MSVFNVIQIFGANQVELFVSIHFILFCFRIWIAFLSYFNSFEETEVQVSIWTKINTKKPNLPKLKAQGLFIALFCFGAPQKLAFCLGKQFFTFPPAWNAMKSWCCWLGLFVHLNFSAYFVMFIFALQMLASACLSFYFSVFFPSPSDCLSLHCKLGRAILSIFQLKFWWQVESPTK